MTHATGGRRELQGARTFLTTSEAARLMGVHPSSISRWINSGRIRALTTPGGHRRIPLGEIEGFLSAAQLDPPEPGER